MDIMQNLKDYLAKIDEVNENGKYKPDWKSLVDHKVPDWYRNAKFGIFIHWGVYAVPAFGNEWYARFMYQPNEGRRGLNYFDHHVETYGAHKDFGYKDFVPMFKAEKFSAKEWLDLFEEAGAKFVLPVAEHHDGFQMYDSVLSEWCATKKGPMKDIVGELKTETEARNMTFCASSHRIEHYWFMDGGREFDSDFPEELVYGDMYWPSMPKPSKESKDVHVGYVDPLFMEDWLARTCELVDKYQPKIVYFDWWIQVAPLKPYLMKFMAYYYNRAEEWGKEVTVNYKNDAFMHTSAVKDIERGQLSDVSPFFWQNDTSVAKNSWCYTEGNDYKEPVSVICDLIDVVSKNGSLLLNVGPKADGTIPAEDAHILREVGAWLKVNGEAIYDTTCWRKYGEGPTLTPEGHFTDTLRKEFTSEDFRFTFNAGTLYAIAMNWPEDGVVRIKILGKQSKQFNAVVESVEVLGHEGAKYQICDDHMTVICDGIKTGYPVAIKIKTI